MDSFSTNLNCYRPSGAFPPAGIAAFFVGAAAGVLLAPVYAFANYHIPLVYLNVLLLWGFGLLLGWIVSWGVRKFHVRNPLAAAVMGVAVFAAAYSVHWFFYLATVLVDGMTDSPYDVEAIADFALALMKDPAEAWELLWALNEEGVWSLSGSSSSSNLAVKGLELAAIWLGEALVLLFLAVKKPWEEAGKPYSERLDAWMEAKDLPVSVAFVENREEFGRAVGRGDYSALTTPLPPSEEVKYAKVRLYSDALDPCVSVENVSVTKKKKKETVSKKEVVRYLKISPTAASDISRALAGD
ncbi:MAG: hypothetical protein LBL51_00255 [Synergistaceae bacterium]|jgi:hypothetical protein|nr:hypothetical protein [Synergistaceae bacterium]